MSAAIAIPVGTKVKLHSTGEVGIVVHDWWNAEMDSTDYYVVFFGKSFPQGQPKEVPYILRYLATSLEIIES